MMDALWRPAGAAVAAAAAVAWCSARHRASSSLSAATSARAAAGAAAGTAWYPAGRLRAAEAPASAAQLAQWAAARAGASRCVGDGPDAKPFAVVLLNTEPGCGLLGGTEAGGESFVSVALSAAWAQAAVVVVADGAANYLFDSALSDKHRLQRLPHVITGDLDSIRPEVLEYYTVQGVATASRPSQDAHDFNKSLQVARESESLQGEVLEEVYVFGSMGGRFDHVAAMLATMYEHVDTLNMVIVTPFNTMWLLGAGKHTMLMDDVIQGTTCGVLPMGVPVREVTTQGLKWDLGGEWGAMSIGTPADETRTYMPPSSSNEAVGIGREEGDRLSLGLLREIRLEASDPIVWCIEHSRMDKAKL